uniref:Putative signal transduction protein with Nacht domain n=1 Tax=Geobacter sp. (strain M21) TaxID=443144 RepID=C6E3B0_GEOSM
MQFTATTLPEAIKSLFEINHYRVEGPLQIHGAEIDLVARNLSDPFAAPVYIEATVEYVDNDKYGKDVGKLAMIAEIEPDAKRLIVSSSGFTLPVKERAAKTRIMTMTYDELFASFEKFERYISLFSGETEEAAVLEALSNIYEEPYFDDHHGKDLATAYLDEWKAAEKDSKGWLVITGEYGTGKTALTKILQYRWLKEYKANPQLPLPLRLELREFTKQFDARGLLHHFLDSNNLGHVSVDFVLSLIKSGRAILLLDGYDEMAQYLHARERRTCLEALAELSTGGAKGILTSRPNYFTEAEELQVFEILYSSFQQGQLLLTKDSKSVLEQEKQVDDLLEQFIDRYERSLSDLSHEQTVALISRVLDHDEEGKIAVLNLLKRIFRSIEGNDALSLSGKPVIVSYLLDVVEELKSSSSNQLSDGITEWQVYRLIVDQLMMRDFKRCPDILPAARRDFLRKVAMFLSKRENALIDQNSFKDLISKEFKKELGRLPPEARSHHLEKLFADLRASATLTRSTRHEVEGWKFSHNSLREYLVAEYLLAGLQQKDIVLERVPISDAMRIFVASIDSDSKNDFLKSMTALWQNSNSKMDRGKGQLLTLLWEGLLSIFQKEQDPAALCLKAVASEPPQLQHIELDKLELSSERHPAALKGANFNSSTLYGIKFSSAKLDGANFTDCTIEGCNFSYADLNNATFSRSLLIDCDITGASLDNADFTGVHHTDITVVIDEKGARKVLDGKNAIGYLRYRGAKTDQVENLYVLKNHQDFPVVDKILVKLAEHPIRQRIGLEQRGAARQDVTLAKSFMLFLEQNKLVAVCKNRKELVEVTDKGREIINLYSKSDTVPEAILQFFE